MKSSSKKVYNKIMSNPKLFYTKKLAHLRSLERLIGEARKTLSELSRLEEGAPGGDVGEFFFLNDGLDSLETTVTDLADSIETLL